MARQVKPFSRLDFQQDIPIGLNNLMEADRLDVRIKRVGSTLATMPTLFRALLKPLWNSARDLLPIVCVVAVFQLFVFRQPLENLAQLLVGLAFVIVGLTLFIIGLEMGLFPLGENMANQFARRGKLFGLIAFAFSIGFGTTFAEPALIAVAGKAAELSVENDEQLEGGQLEEARAKFALQLRVVVALAVGSALVIGVFRILKGWPLHYMIMAGYVLVMILTSLAPDNIIGVAYDSGGVTTSTITVPLTAALGVGLASSIRGRSPLLDGFGLIAFASLTPILFVLAMGIIWL